MLRNTWWALLPAVLAAGFLCAPSALARDVKDEADLIKKQDSLTRINQIIKEINKNFGKEVLIETTSTVPTADVNKVKAMVEAKDSDALKTYFFELSRSRAKANKVDGIYVLVNKNPRWLQILTNKKTEPYFDRSQVKEMRSLMETQFKKGNFDEGFLEGVQYVRDQFTKNPPKAAAAPPVAKNPKATGGVLKDERGEWNWTGIICVGLVVLVVVWLIIGLIRAMSMGGGGGGYGAPGYAGGGGGGFMSGLLGGLFGAMAGNWLYHNMFGGGSHWGSSAYGSDAGTSGSAGDDDYTGSGGGIDDAGGGGGDAGGGGDWGGGGDVGGGDWGGGGGGDWGGGGGDFGGGFGGGGGDF
jgi:uncharacterized protein